MRIDRRELVRLHNPVLNGVDEASPLTVGNGELAFTADVTGMQTLYSEYRMLPLCTMATWGWHTRPVSDTQDRYTLKDLRMTCYDLHGRHTEYPQEKYEGNEAVYDWLRQNPHRFNLVRIGLTSGGGEICSSRLGAIHQELELYEGILTSDFTLDGRACRVRTACAQDGQPVLAFRVEGEALADGSLAVRLDFPYGSPDISGSDWESVQRHRTEVLCERDGYLLAGRTLDQDQYEVEISAPGAQVTLSALHCIEIRPRKTQETLSFTVALRPSGSAGGSETLPDKAEEVFRSSRDGWRDFWETCGAVRLNRSRDPRAFELERRIVLSQYLMAVNSSGSMPPQETGLTCNSWYGKMHLEMYLWHCAWLPLWGLTSRLEKSIAWYHARLPQARENAARNGFRGARWPKMVASEGIDAPSNIAPLLVWQQPHIIYMLEMAYRRKPDPKFLAQHWELVRETADFMADYALWNEETRRYDLCAPVIPVQECHKAAETHNPAFEIEYWHFTLKIALEWCRRLGLPAQEHWAGVCSGMAELSEENGVYLAHEHCPETYTKYNLDHPSMLGAYGLIDSNRIDRETMRRTLHRVLECWNYQSLWGWDFALMAMTAVRLGEPDTAIDILMKDTLKNRYVASGNNLQETRTDLPLYLPGNGSLLLAAAMMTAGYEGCSRPCPGFPDDGSWTVEYDGILGF